MWNVMQIVLPVFLIIGLGWGIRRAGLVDDTFFLQINKFVFYVCLPLLLIYKIGTADFSVSFNIRLVIATGSAIGCCFFISYLYGAKRGFPPPILGAFCQGSFRGNLAYIGLAIVYNAYGDIGLTSAGILLGFLVPVLNFFAILALTLPQQQHRINYQNIAWQMAVNPLILSSLIGIAWSYFHLPMPEILDRSLAIATGMTLPLALLSIGGSFSAANFRGDFGKAGLASTIKLIVLPLLTAVFLLLFGVTGMDFAIGLLMAGAPAAVATYIRACQMGGDGRLAGTIVVMSTAASLLSYTLILLCLHLASIGP
ncbi:MAG TPA: AEC family transporter [Desulfobulbaceae bacterium]|nr:AEC family transporter [Desulfobulbaceae bacterium]